MDTEPLDASFFISFHFVFMICMRYLIITGRNEVVVKVMFLHVCVILFTGGISGQGEPLQAGRIPPGPGTPPGTSPPRSRPPRTRHPPGPGTPTGADTPPPRSRPSWTRHHPPRPGTHPPPRKQTAAYG